MEINNNANQEPHDPVARKQHNFSTQWLRVEGRLGNVKYYFNSFVAASTLLIVIATIIWAFADGESKNKLTDAKRWINDVWAWLYVAEQFVWVAFVLFIYFRWGHIKLGRDNDEPEHGDLTYFVMIFCTGLSSAKYYSGVVDPVTHYEYDRKNSSMIYWGKSGLSEHAQNSINITLHHWGIFGFSVYALPAITISFLAYRKGLPVTMRTCLYPIIGHKIYGRVGDLIDITSASVTIFGVSVGLAYGTDLLLAGIKEWFPEIELSSSNHIIAIWILVCVATVSVVSGIGLGIKHLSLLSFFLSVVVLLVVLMADNTWHLLNVFIQSIGYQIQHVIGTGLHTGAFDHHGNEDNPENWLNDNTLFYYGWWIAVAPLSATFTARISRGRRISELITYIFFCPTAVLMLWFATFGGISIEMQQKATDAGIKCEGLYDQMQRSKSMEEKWEKLDKTYNIIDNLVCLDASAKLFAVMRHYKGIFKILHAFTMLGITLQFITHADSSSLVIDIIASNGNKNPPIVQRGFWALVQGAASTAFVQYAQDSEGLKTIQAVAVIASVPLIVIVNTCCIGLWRVLSKEKEFKLDTKFKEWKMYYGNIDSKQHFKDTLIATICPWWYIGKIVVRYNGYNRKLLKLLSYLSSAVPFYLWLALLIAQVAVDDIDKFGWVCLLFFIAHISYYRQLIRLEHRLVGNIVEDFIVTMLYPFAILQMFHECDDVTITEINHVVVPTFIRTDHLQTYESGFSLSSLQPSIVLAEYSSLGTKESSADGDVRLSIDTHDIGASNFGYLRSEISDVIQLDGEVVII